MAHLCKLTSGVLQRAGAIGRMLPIWACLLLGCASLFGQIPTITHSDSGTTTTNPNGSTTTTYKDGWTKTVEPDNSTGKPEMKETVKDPNGKIHEIFRRDIKTGAYTYHFIIVDDAGGGKTTYTDIGNVKTKVVEKPNGDKKSYEWKLNPRTKKNEWVEDTGETSSTSGISAQKVTVSGTADIHLAGQPNGTTLGSDSAPQNSPIEIKNLEAGQHVSISATGLTCNDGNNGCAGSPDGGSGAGGVGGNSDFGLSAIAGFPINALVGVFLGPMRSDPASTPAVLNANQGFSSAAPVLRQVFFIGAGPRSFTVPKGATRLFLGSTDTPGTNYNNAGSFAVTVSVGPSQGKQSGSSKITGSARGALPLSPTGSETQGLVGEWHWSHVGFSGRLRITTQNPDGTFSGEFIDYGSTIEGRLQGERIEFFRRFVWNDGKQKEQRFEATLVASGDSLKMVNGRVTGFDGQGDPSRWKTWWGDFSADKVSNAPQEFHPCFKNSGSVASAGPCVLAPGSLLWVHMSRQLPNPPATLKFKTVLTSGVPAAVSSPLSGGGEYYSTPVPTQVCATGTNGKWAIFLLDSKGRPWGNIGQLTVDCHAFHR